MGEPSEYDKKVKREIEARLLERDPFYIPGENTNNGGFFKKLWADQVTMWKAFGSTLKKEGLGGIPGWIKIFLVPLAIFVVVVGGVWILTKPKYRDRRRSHHGINKYGERY